ALFFADDFFLAAFFVVPLLFPFAFFFTLTARPPQNCRRRPNPGFSRVRHSHEQQRLNPQIPRRQCAKLRCNETWVEQAF
ncbi:MAG: hypothetical protein WBW77_16000, partial [Candidatus Sulfotelmatobacter sp.]